MASLAGKEFMTQDRQALRALAERVLPLKGTFEALAQAVLSLLTELEEAEQGKIEKWLYQVEVERAEAAEAELRYLRSQYVGRSRELDQAEAENQHLKDALREILELDRPYSTETTTRNRMVDIAKRALGD